ncbi:MAG: hypothetical protein RKE49_10275 [Oceanicaulis sp.]
MRELSMEEIDLVIGGEGSSEGGEGGISDKDAAGCMIGFGSMAVAVVAGVSGPVGWALFGATAVTTLMTCSPD